MGSLMCLSFDFLVCPCKLVEEALELTVNWKGQCFVDAIVDQ